MLLRELEDASQRMFGSAGAVVQDVVQLLGD